MEFISPTQLQKYDDIIARIKQEFEKHETLKKDLERENDNLILSQLANSKLTKKLSHINVQVYDNFADCMNLYGDELQSDFYNLSNCSYFKFYLIDVYITKSLMQKANGLKCLLHISLKTENDNINKIILLTDKIPIKEVIPLDRSIINSVIEVSLVVPLLKGNCSVIKLDTVHIDISYHFQTYTANQKLPCTTENVLKVTNCYSQNKVTQKLPLLERKLFCNVETDRFISAVLKNSYHAVNVDSFQELNPDKDKEFVLKLSNGLNVFVIKFNRREKYLKIEANADDLLLLKTYFCKELYSTGTLNSVLLSNVLKTLKIYGNTLLGPEDVCSFFSEVRESWSQLPV